MKHVVMFSGGLGSWVTAKRAAEKARPEDITLLFADVGNDSSPHVGEDEDTYRFVTEAAANVGAPLVTVSDGRDIWQVFHDDRFLGNSRLANCSKFLKQRPCREWLEANCDPEDTIVYVGIDWTETHRLPAIEAGWAPYPVHAPLTEPPLLDRDDMQAMCVEAGIEIPRLYRAGFPHNNPLSGDTRVPTSRGVFTLKDLAEGPSTAEVVTSVGWRPATVNSYGTQVLRTITVERSGVRRQVRATADHKWPVEALRDGTGYTETRTDKLVPGDRLSYFAPVPYDGELDAEWVARGIVYGDGSSVGHTSSRVLLCGEKRELDKWFPDGASRIDHANGLHVGRLPFGWKHETPDRNDRRAWASFLAGWFAADGSLGLKAGGLSMAKRSDVDLALDAAAIAGVAATNVCSYEREGYGQVSTLHEVSLRMPRHLVLRSRHLAAWREPQNKPRRWRVVSVEDLGQREEVFCLVVPGPHNFSLEFGLGTLNCGGFCVRGGQAQMELLLREHPDRYAFHEAEEAKLRDHLGKDVAILRDRTGGTVTPLTLRGFRERIEDQPNLFDPLDFGGCGCFTEGPSE